MSLLDTITDGVHRFLPQKREKLSEPISATGNIGHGFSNHHEDMILSKPAIVCHALQIFFTFIAMCCFASVASFQGKWKVGPSGLSIFVLLFTIPNILLSVFLVTVPVIYDKYDKGIRLARALREVRVQFILTGAGIASMPLVALVATISAFTQPGCKDPSKDPHADLGDDFKKGLSGFCRDKKSGAIFLWLAAIAYIAAFGYLFYKWRRGDMVYGGGGGGSNAARDPPFTHPEDPSQDFDEVEDPYNRPIERVSERPPRIDEDITSPFADRYSAPGRQSMDAYGAFNDDAPAGYGNNSPTGYGGRSQIPPPAVPGPGVSRTMQFADPYAAVRTRIAGSSPAPQIPQPPSYEYPGGYR